MAPHARQAVPPPEPCPRCGGPDLRRLLDAHARSSRRGDPLLTPAGLRWLCRPRGPRGARAGPARGPRWDAPAGVLWLGDRRLHGFRKAAPAQFAILAAFEAAGWPESVGTPLAREPGETDPEYRKRLANTVANLNRELPADTIRFRRTPAALGVRWEHAGGRKGRRR